jgi:hypothetical protein
MQNAVCTFYDQSTAFDEKDLSVDQFVERNGAASINQIEQRKSTSQQIDRENMGQDQALELFANNLQVYLNNLNTKRTEIDKANFEATIEKDFIDQEAFQSSPMGK